MKKIATIGTSDRKPGEFIEVLQHHGIQLLVDIRRFPTSRFSHFNKENLEKLCHNNKIDYLWLGDLLGGYRKEGYEAYMATNTFLDGLAQLESRAGAQATAFCCAERFPWKCHRRFIAQELHNKGWEVFHIIDRDKTWNPRQLNLF